MLAVHLLVSCSSVVQPALQWQHTQMSRRGAVRVWPASIWLLLLLWRHGAITRGLRCAVGAWLLVCRPPCIRGTKSSATVASISISTAVNAD